MKLILQKPDTFGALASALCLIHCLATPFIFIAHVCTEGGCKTAPIWWQSIDYIFLVVSFFAVYRSTQTTSKKFMKTALWVSWGALFITILNEKFVWLHLSEMYKNVAALTLVALHLYNLKFCQCKTDNCCVNHG